MVKVRSGEITFHGERIDGLSTPDIVAKGITMVPENRRLFAKMTVRENLEIGANLRNDKAAIANDVEGMFEMFPRLRGTAQADAPAPYPGVSSRCSPSVGP